MSHSALTRFMTLNWAAFQSSHWPHAACRPQIGHVSSIVHSWCGKLPAFWQMYNDIYQSASHHTEYCLYPRNLFCVPLTTPQPASDNCWFFHWLCEFTFQECHRNEFIQEASFKNLLLFFTLCVWVFCQHVFMCATCTPSAHGGQKMVSDL